MIKLRYAAVALGIAAGGALVFTGTSQADLAANQSRISNLGQIAGAGVQTVDWRIKTAYYNGCNRSYYCKSRKQICDSYGYNCKWQYWDCYYGSCLGGY